MYFMYVVCLLFYAIGGFDLFIIFFCSIISEAQNGYP